MGAMVALSSTQMDKRDAVKVLVVDDSGDFADAIGLVLKSRDAPYERRWTGQRHLR